jgi:hypothetical protein
MQAEKLNVPLILHPTNQDIRLVLPVISGRNVKRTLAKLPSLSVFPPLGFELVSADTEAGTEARRLLNATAEKLRFSASVFEVRHFNQRPNPRSR